MNIENELKAMTEGLKLKQFDNPHAPAAAHRASGKPSAKTILEALEKLEQHAISILSNARRIETNLTGGGQNDWQQDDVPAGPGIWDQFAAKIVVIERIFGQIDEVNDHSLGSLQ